MSLRLASPFLDHAVLQRGQPLPVWGWAAPMTRVRVTLAGHEAHTLSSDHGDWSVRLPALPAGGPHTLVVTAADGETLTISDLLVGEVWIASGQSNMEWPLDQSRPFADDAIATADFPGIRFFTSSRRTHLGAQRTVDGASWQRVSPAAAPRFSAVAFAFARRLHRELGVPVGILSVSWGGTFIETWTSRSTLALNPDIAPWLAAYEANTWTAARWKDVGPMGSDGRAANSMGESRPADPGITQPWGDAALDDSDWDEIKLPSTWQRADHRYSGVFWFRRVIELPADWVGKDLVLNLGAADKQDITYVNGVEVGRSGTGFEDCFWNVARTYAIPAVLVSGRRLVVACRVYSFIYDGGLIGPAAAMNVHPAGDAASALPLAGDWRFRNEHNFGLVVRPPGIMGHGEENTPHMLFDNLVAPLVPYALRGAIWYQGESNESAPHLYARLLRDLVDDWRRQWGQPSLAFHIVQLTAFRSPQAHQPESNWARIREAQTSLLATPGTGLAVITDLGDAADIHPRNKIPVGERLAQSALARDYARPLVANGPVAASFAFNGPAVRVSFDYADGVLSTTDGAAPATVFLAGADRVFYPATALIEGTSVIVTSPAVSMPVAVRYAWADNPEGANLAGGSGLPASPFRSDHW
jgi:sialate O-acetylesterase